MHDKATAASRSGNSFAAWREVTPQHNALVRFFTPFILFRRSTRRWSRKAKGALATSKCARRCKSDGYLVDAAADPALVQRFIAANVAGVQIF